MKSKGHHVIGSYIQPVLDAYLHQGGRISLLADALSLPDVWFFHLPDKIPVSLYFQLLLKASQLVKQPQLGIEVGQYAGLSSFSVLGQALEHGQKNAATLAQALQQVMVLERLVHRLGDSRIEQEGKNVRLIWRSNFQQHIAANLVSESVLSGIIQLAQKLTGRLIPILDVTFVHFQPIGYLDSGGETKQEYQKAFRAQCRFNQASNSILIAADVLAWPLKKSAQRSSLKLVDNHISDQVITQLEQGLSSSPKLAQVAAILGLSERSLQRKLKAEGKSFQGLLAQVRLQQALDYLQYSNLSLLQVSQLLGFKEQSSFNQFFQQSTGESPSAFRANN